MQADKLSAAAGDALRQNTALVQQLSKEIRTISHLLHPPLLDEIGLLPAIKMFADGFAERSNIQGRRGPFPGHRAACTQGRNFDFSNRARMLDQCLSPFGKQDGVDQDMAFR